MRNFSSCEISVTYIRFRMAWGHWCNQLGGLSVFRYVDIYRNPVTWNIFENLERCSLFFQNFVSPLSLLVCPAFSSVPVDIHGWSADRHLLSSCLKMTGGVEGHCVASRDWAPSCPSSPSVEKFARAFFACGSYRAIPHACFFCALCAFDV